MRAYVYTDKALDRYAGQFVWLSINTEDAKNADFLGKYKIPVLPTLLVLEPNGEAIRLRYVGGATTGNLTKLLGDAQKRPASSADTLLASADKLSAAGKHAEAAKLYEQALREAPGRWSRYGRTAESLLFALSSSNQSERCATVAFDVYPRLKGTVSGAIVAASGLDCATSLDEKNAKRGEMIAFFEKATRAALDDPKLDLSADDKSSLYIALIGARDDRKLKEEWARFLEQAAAKAKTAEQRAVYDSHRISAYLDLGTPEKAIPMLEQSERDFPDDYNPPARLALAYKAMKQYDKALAASDRAMKRVYGPRKVTVLRTRADIYSEMRDKEAARRVIAEAVEYAKGLPAAQRNERTIASLEKKLAELN